ncbi:MAG TPA: hypothetical protein VMS76_03535 [Planctomycetota bacterium]|nr:hypothetical protein [Planctomycetota bacterium]
MVQGHLNYFAVHGNYRRIQAFRNQALVHWHKAASSRSQKGYVNWRRMYRLAKLWVPPVRILHPWPEERLCVKT